MKSPVSLNRMTIEQFVAQSIGDWKSMRSGHSLAFQIFEDVISEISITEVSTEDKAVLDLLEQYKIQSKYSTPFFMKWEADSDWEPDDPSDVSSGECLIIPVPTDEDSGILIRSVGYAEAEQAMSSYHILQDGTFTLITEYGQSIAEERIWFVSENVRCRSSVIRTSEGSGVLQTSFASEIRRLNL